jgi:WD40 repeat protein
LVLGEGGFATVVRAHDDALDGDVAIKILDAAHATDPDVRARFVREAQLLRRVHSPFVVAVHDVGELEDGRPYLVMEFASGGSLSDRLPAGPGVDADGLASVILALGGGLGALHEAGVVHRDVKPANLLVIARRESRALGHDATSGRRGLFDRGERMVMGDLGLAKDQERTSSEPTIVGGTPHYQAPEQTQLGAPVGPATDTFAATAVLWRLVTGTVPPLPAAIEASLVGVPGTWHDFFMRGMAAEPDDRFATAEEWEAAASASLATGAGILRTGSVGVTVSQPGATCPYKGLAAFQPEDAALFFGREELVDKLVSRLRAAPVLVIGGPSGCGKSSLLRAGLLPAIEAGALPGSQGWPVALLTPGSEALKELQDALGQLAATVPVPSIDDLRADPGSVRSIATSTDGGLIALDQFEELFTLNSSEDAATVTAVLAALVAPAAGRVRVVLSLRADFYAECAQHEWLARCISDNQVLVGPMRRAELRRAIEQPATRVGLRLEDGLTEMVLDDGAATGSLPLIAHALMETWIRRRGTLLTVEGFRGAGGVVGAMAQRADALYEQFQLEEREAARRLLLRLLNPGDGTPDTRRRVTWRELGDNPVQRRVIDAMAAARLLTVDDRRVEFAHESIIHGWPLLHGWVEQAREDLRTRARILRAAEEWDSQERNAALLYRGSPLEAASAWAAGHPGELGPLDADFIATSEAVEREEVERATSERHRRRRVRRVAVSALAILAVAAVLASAIALVALQRSRSDERDAKERAAQLLGTQAFAESGADPLLGLALAAESIARTEIAPVDARRALVESRVQLAETVGPVPFGAPFPVGDARALTVTPDGESVVTGSRTGDITLWDATTGARKGILTAPEGGIQDLAVDPGGRWLVAGDDDGRVWLWDLRSPTHPPTEPLVDLGELRRNNVAWSVAFSPDGDRIAVATEFIGVVLVDPRSGAARRTSGTRGAADILSVVFSPDGRRLAAGTGTGEVMLLSVATGDRVGSVVAHPDDDVWELVFDRSGETLTTGSSDGTARSWDATSLEPVGATLRPPESSEGGGLQGIALSMDGRRLYAGSTDGTVRTFDRDSGTQLEVTGAAHSEEVIGAATSADGVVLITLGDDEQVRRWSLRRRPSVGIVRGSLRESGAGIAVDPATGRIAVSDSEGGVHIFLPGEGDRAEPGPVLPGHDGASFGMAFLPSGDLLTGDATGSLSRWDPESGRLEVARSGAHDSQIMGLATSPDGTVVATVAVDGTARLWEARQLTPRSGPLVTGAAGGGDLAFTPDGDRLVVGTGRTITVWTSGGAPVDRVDAAEDVIWGIAVSPDGAHVATASADRTVSVRSLENLTAVDHRLGHSGVATDVAFSTDGETLVTTSRSGEVRLWDRRSGELLGQPFASEADRIGEVWRLAYDPRHARVWFAGKDGEVRETDALDLEVGCQLAKGLPDVRQQQRFLGGETAIGCG